MKNTIQKYLQKILGFNNYLFIFSVFKILTLRFDRKENDFFYFLRLLPENAIVLDIGANIGIMSVHLCKNVKKGMVYAFEPIP
jgi:ubiquinone/menaquinone biosynthesis C-methylase UbiE